MLEHLRGVEVGRDADSGELRQLGLVCVLGELIEGVDAGVLESFQAPDLVQEIGNFLEF